MKIIVFATFLTTGMLFCARDAQPKLGWAVAIARWTESGGETYYSRNGSPWRLVANGMDPALSPNGRLLAFTHCEPRGASHDRFVRVVDVDTDAMTPLLHHEGAMQEYGAQWAADGRAVFFKLFIGDEWIVGRLSYPEMGYTRIEDAPFAVYQPGLSADGRYELTVEPVATDAPLAHDEPTALFLLEHPGSKRSRITPSDLWVAQGACWLGATRELLVAGAWRKGADVLGPTEVFRIDPFDRPWATTPKSAWSAKRVFEGSQVSCSRE
jgi:hypothetical protein